MVALESAAERVGILEPNGSRYTFDSAARDYQPPSCLIKADLLNESGGGRVEESLKKPAEMTGAEACPLREPLHGKIFV